jgi:hypothetical protein
MKFPGLVIVLIFLFGQIATAQDTTLIKADLSMSANKAGTYKDLTLQLKLATTVPKKKIRFRGCLQYEYNAYHDLYENPDVKLN